MAEARRAPLKAVGGTPTTRAKRAPVRKPAPIKTAAESGKRRELLVATRDRIAAACDSPDTPPRDLAALTRRLLDIAKEIEAMDARDEDEATHTGTVGDSFDASSL